MYKFNDPIQCEGRVGRVFSLGERRTIHVLVRVNEHTWRVETWYTMGCEPYHGFLWTFQNAFRTQLSVRTPSLAPMEIEDDIHVIHLL